MLTLPHSYDLTVLDSLEIHAAGADAVTWQGRPALRLENGLVLLPQVAADLCLEVEIAAEGACYPGLAFRTLNPSNYELIYAQPHTSGLWDAIQYDPVFRGSNTWQIHHGPAHQKAAQVPMHRWFCLRVDVLGLRAAASVDGQPPLAVARLMHGEVPGRMGVWTFLPAYFTALRLGTPDPSRLGRPEAAPVPPQGTVASWQLEGVGPVEVEANGILNLNRCLDWQPGREAVLRGRFAVSEATEVELLLGYSDELILALDGEEVYSGSCTFHPPRTGMSAQDARESRGYIVPGANRVRATVGAGEHALAARVRTVESYGWGLTVAVRACCGDPGCRTS